MPVHFICECRQYNGNVYRYLCTVQSEWMLSFNTVHSDYLKLYGNYVLSWPIQPHNKPMNRISISPWQPNYQSRTASLLVTWQPRYQSPGSLIISPGQPRY
jgi:hypothetical protein